MRVLVMVKANEESESGGMPREKDLAAMGKFNEGLVKAGIMLAAEGLHPTSRGKRVRCLGDRWTVIDGPFDRSKDIVAGYWVWRVTSIEEAVDLVKRAPFGGDIEVEIRPIFEMADFAASDPTGELRRKEEELRKEIETRPCAA